MKEKLPINITIDDMPNADMKLVAETCGVETAVKLLTELPGIQINIPKAGVRRVTWAYVRKNYNGKNIKKLALEVGLSENWLYQILKKDKSLPGNTDIEIIDGQLDLFERSNNNNGSGN